MVSNRVLVTSPPVIPADIPSGTYWIGVITQSYDADSSNNDTDGIDAYEITVQGCSVSFTPFGVGLPGSGGFAPFLYGTGDSCMASGHHVNVAGALGGTVGNLWISIASTDLFPTFGGGHFYIDMTAPSNSVPMAMFGPAGVPGGGYVNLVGREIRDLAGITVYLQLTLLDPGAIEGISMSNGLTIQISP
jgi:hypothetical protein